MFQTSHNVSTYLIPIVHLRLKNLFICFRDSSALLLLLLPPQSTFSRTFTTSVKSASRNLPRPH